MLCSAPDVAFAPSVEAPFWPPVASLDIEHARASMDDALVDTPFGTKHVISADPDAAGRGMPQAGRSPLLQAISPHGGAPIGNGKHGQHASALVEGAREAVAQFCGAPRDQYAVVFASPDGAGALYRFAHLLDVVPRAAALGTDVPLPVVVVSEMDRRAHIAFWRKMHCTLEVRLARVAFPLYRAVAECWDIVHIDCGWRCASPKET